MLCPSTSDCGTKPACLLIRLDFSPGMGTAMLMAPVIEPSTNAVSNVFFVMRILMERVLEILDIVMDNEGVNWIGE